MKTQRELAIAICEALHLPPGETGRIEIVVEPGRVEVRAELRIKSGPNGDQIVNAIAECELVPKGHGEVLDVKVTGMAGGDADVTAIADRVRRLLTEAPIPRRM